MGDVGSTYLAFMIFALALFSTRAGWLNYPAWLILGASFIADASVTLVRRFLAGERWFEAHRSHAYQHLARRFSHRRATLAYLIINAGWLAPMAALSLKTAPGWDWLLAAIAYAPLCLAALACRAGKA